MTAYESPEVSASASEEVTGHEWQLEASRFLLSLPLEIRSHIYTHILALTHTSSRPTFNASLIHTGPDSLKSIMTQLFPPSLAQTCRQLRNEVLDHLYSIIRIEHYSPSRMKGFRRWRSSYAATISGRVRRVELMSDGFHAFGSGEEFFFGPLKGGSLRVVVDADLGAKVEWISRRKASGGTLIEEGEERKVSEEEREDDAEKLVEEMRGKLVIAIEREVQFDHERGRKMFRDSCFRAIELVVRSYLYKA